ncbi:ABC transporter ATP-binding protein [Cuniculiplasma sp. SKW4]|uniref:ABC transporter ATP-binding protein n=1 Tax=Cuniculiplasma sp. SKW4 TaxID=3400171 RepID=UPI003FCF678B
MTIEAKSLEFKRGSLNIGPIDLKLSEGEILSICGKNGSGKTSTINVLSGLNKYEFGDINIDGISIRKMTQREISRKIAVVKQEIPVPMSFTVRDIMEISAFTRGDDEASMIEALSICAIPHLLDRDFLTLSGGEKRMVMIAAGIYQDSRYIFMDEPSSFLDIDKISSLTSILKNLKKMGKGIIVVIHDINYASKVSDKMVLMKEGKIMDYGETKQILTIENLEKTYNAKFQMYDSPEGKRFFSDS